MSAAEWESPNRKRMRNRKVLHTTTAKPCVSDYFNPINIGVKSITCEKITADSLSSPVASAALIQAAASSVDNNHFASQLLYSVGTLIIHILTVACCRPVTFRKNWEVCWMEFRYSSESYLQRDKTNEVHSVL